jgi:hypothetical protein
MFMASGTPATKPEAKELMRENDYTGHLIDTDDDDAFLPADAELFDWEADEDALPPEIAYGGGDEEIIHVASAADGAKTLQEAAKMLYDFADELLELSASGWEILDDITNGHGVAVSLSDDSES